MAFSIELLIKALQGAGRPIDPRVWIMRACVIGPAVFGTEDEVDKVITYPIRLLHNQVPTHAYYTGMHGLDHGVFWPLDVDDTVLVVAEYADHRWGLKIIARWWDPGTPAPELVRADTDAPAFVVPDGKVLRVEVRGAGRVEIFRRDGQGDVDGVPTVTQLNERLSTVEGALSKLENHSHIGFGPGAGTSTPMVFNPAVNPGPGPVPPPGSPVAPTEPLVIDKPAAVDPSPVLAATKP